METATPASAPTETTPQTVPADLAVVDTNNFSAYEQAKQAKRDGKPLAAVEVTPAVAEAVDDDADDGAVVAPAQTAAERQLSKRQQKANAEIQQAVERATAELRAEVARLKTPAPPAEPAKPAPVAVPEYKRYLSLPDAPKLADFESLEEHAAAMAVFVADQRDAIRAAKDSDTRAVESATKTITTFQQQITEAGGRDFLDGLRPEVQQLRPVEALQARGEGDRVGPLNVLSSQILKSASAPQLLQHFSDHPEALDTFRQCGSVGDVYVELGKVLATLDPPTRSASPVKTHTSAPPPPTTLSTARPAAPADPMAAAVARNDPSAFFAAKRAKQQAQRA